MSSKRYEKLERENRGENVYHLSISISKFQLLFKLVNEKYFVSRDLCDLTEYGANIPVHSWPPQTKLCKTCGRRCPN